ncbi:NAD(P)/FAD-dependent oxidoreductase [Lentzea sp. NPDC004782]|uniref:NAD(P)/FAD-dependent oxidoreductase n=1 Tax=Lentzea sp. NPDC004782 TaxID=3154458 RepID=UPI0033B6A1DE
MSYDVIVVGARCAGAPLAMLLARAGRSVLLLDRSRFPSETMSTHWVLRQGIDLLAEWNLLNDLFATGCPPITEVRMDFGDVVLSGVPTTASGATAVTCAPRRFVLDNLLVRAAVEAGVEVREGVAVSDVVWEDGAVVGVTGAGFTERARLVVGADGRNSTIARAVGAATADDRGALTATSYAYWSGLDVSGVETTIRPGCGVSMWPTHDGLTVVGLVLPRQDFLSRKQPGEQIYLDSLAQFDRLRGCRVESRVRVATNLRNYHRRSHGPGWVLAGDAGYHQDPIGAHGISNAFSDADQLSRTILRALDGGVRIERGLARYEARRNADRAASFEFTCGQAALRPVNDFDHVLSAAAAHPATASELLGMFVGGRRIEQFFAPANLARMIGG